MKVDKKETIQLEQIPIIPIYFKLTCRNCGKSTDFTNDIRKEEVIFVRADSSLSCHDDSMMSVKCLSCHKNYCYKWFLSETT